MSNMSSKVAPLNIRVREDQRHLIEQGAQARHKTLSDFVRDAALEEAANALLDSRQFALDGADYDAFMAALDEPPAENSTLRDLMSRKPAWDA